MFSVCFLPPRARACVCVCFHGDGPLGLMFKDNKEVNSDLRCWDSEAETLCCGSLSRSDLLKLLPADERGAMKLEEKIQLLKFSSYVFNCIFLVRNRSGPSCAIKACLDFEIFVPLRDKIHSQFQLAGSLSRLTDGKSAHRNVVSL